MKGATGVISGLRGELERAKSLVQKASRPSILKWIIILVVLVAAAAGAFFVGMGTNHFCYLFFVHCLF